jgi:hypothetical protein
MIRRSTGSYGSCSAGRERGLFVVNPLPILELFRFRDVHAWRLRFDYGYRIARGNSYENRSLLPGTVQ